MDDPGLKRQREPGTGSSMLSLVAALLMAGCAWQEPSAGRALATPNEPQPIRPPAIGQQWVYQVRDLYTGRVVDRLTETVLAVSPEVTISRLSDKYGVLPSEVQRPWGRYAQDAQWDRPLQFGVPAPAWPDGMGAASWSGEYRIGGLSDYRYPWSQTLRPLQWELVKVAAGTFETLHYTVHIVYAGPEDYYYVGSERDASVWLAPRVGRWVLRRARGVHYVPGHGGDDLDDAMQWELVSWR